MKLEVLRCYTQEFTDFTAQVNILAERTYPRDYTSRYVLCEWVQDGEVKKYSVNIESIVKKDLHFGDYYFPNQLEEAFTRFLTRKPPSF